MPMREQSRIKANTVAEEAAARIIRDALFGTGSLGARMASALFAIEALPLDTGIATDAPGAVGK